MVFSTPRAKTNIINGPLEEFAIYLNYVRKLGFEEAPDYDFLRDLFAKVLRQNGDADDGLFDWMLLNGGKGIDAGSVRTQIVADFRRLLIVLLGYC